MKDILQQSINNLPEGSQPCGRSYITEIGSKWVTVQPFKVPRNNGFPLVEEDGSTKPTCDEIKVVLEPNP